MISLSQPPDFIIREATGLHLLNEQIATHRFNRNDFPLILSFIFFESKFVTLYKFLKTMPMFRSAFLCILYSSIIIFFTSCNSGNQQGATTKTAAKNSEIIYHVFQRSFYDSNSDQIGDLNGLHEKLDYLQDLGVTSILLLPLYQSVYYHNYYTNDFYKIDSSFGTMADYISLVKGIHQRGMKIYMDMETQYVTEGHPWYKSAVGNLQSPYSDYILFEDSAHEIPATFVLDLRGWTGYNGVYKKIVTVNLKNKDVLDYNIGLFKFWVDPNEDGKFDDGVDGFRFDHMMDNLDNKKQLTGLFKSFWQPLVAELKKLNPALINVAEQAHWDSWGKRYIETGVADRIFSFKLMGAIRSFDKAYLELMADSAFTIFPENNRQVVFIENHDMPRFSYQVNKSLPKMKIGAALNLLLGGTPSIYYGQEIGMYGAGFWGKWGMNDGNEIPEREAFEWYAADTGKGMALWYKDSGIWWDSTNIKADDGISLQEQRKDSNSLFHFYKKIIRIRKSNPAISKGEFQILKNNNKQVFSFQRKNSLNGLMVAINLSNDSQIATLKNNAFDWNEKQMKPLMNPSGQKAVFNKNETEITFAPFEIKVWKIE